MIPLKIETLLEGRVVEHDRVEYKTGWNPNDIIHSICAVFLRAIMIIQMVDYSNRVKRKMECRYFRLQVWRKGRWIQFSRRYFSTAI